MKSLGFFDGFRFLILGWRRVLSSPKLILLALLPFIIDVIFFLVFIWYAMSWVDPATMTVVNWLLKNTSTMWAQVSSYFLYAFFAVGFFALALYATYVVALIICAPFYTMLAEAVIEELHPGSLPKMTFVRWVKTTIGLFIVSCIKAVVFALLGIVIFILTVIPGLNFLGILLALLIVAFDCADYSFEARGWSFRKRVGFFFDHPLVFLGMGLILVLPMFIPGGILLMMPGAVVGAAINTTLILKGEGKRVTK